MTECADEGCESITESNVVNSIHSVCTLAIEKDRGFYLLMDCAVICLKIAPSCCRANYRHFEDIVAIYLSSSLLQRVARFVIFATSAVNSCELSMFVMCDIIEITSHFFCCDFGLFAVCCLCSVI